MKQIVKVSLAALAFLVTACGKAPGDERFCGSRRGNASQLVMEYSDMNLTECQTLDLKAGDMLQFVIESKRGQVDITLQMEENEPVYEESNVSSSAFYIDIEETGEYQIIVTGRNAKGSVSVTKTD